MFYIHDFEKNVDIPLRSEQDVATWWKNAFFRNLPLPLQGKPVVAKKFFWELNVTGKDKAVEIHVTNNMDVSCINSPIYCELLARLRRYQVLDERGRSVDIRSWPKEVWELNQNQHRFGTYWYGGHRHIRRTSGPSMLRKTLRAIAASADYNELDNEGLPLPISDRSKISHPFSGSNDVWDFCEEKFSKKYAASKSWKDQCKARHQWGKHKPRCAVPARVSENTNSILVRLQADGFPVQLDCYA